MSSYLPRRRDTLLGLGAAAASAAFPSHVLAQAAKSLRIVVPFAAGGTADMLPRLLSEKLRVHYPGGVVIDNRAGAGGNIGAEFAYRADPDGSTLLASPPGPIAINQNLYPKLNFDPARWVPVTVIATVPNVLAVSNKLPVRSVAEFLAYVKKNPGTVNVATQGNGSTSHLTAALFMQMTGTQMNLVPYKGTAPALIDLIGGTVDVFFDNISSSLQHHRGGKVRILAVADVQRSKALPEIPTFADQNLPGMQAVTFFSVVAPPGTPTTVAATAQSQIAQALEAPDVRAKFAEQGAEPRGWSPAQTAKFIQTETDRWAKVIRSANVSLE